MMQNESPSMQDILRMAQSPAGQQLIRLLQQNGGQNLQQAMDKAAQGDYTQARALLSSMMQDPQARNLMDQLGR